MKMAKTQQVPDPSRGKTRLSWNSNYDWTVKFFQDHHGDRVIGIYSPVHVWYVEV